MSVQWDGYAAGNEAGAKIIIRNVNLQRHQMRTALPCPQDFLQVKNGLCDGGHRKIQLYYNLLKR